jgi:GTP-binding protein HflX
LEESVLSDFLIHVLDASQPEVLTFHDTTMKVLGDLGAEEKRMILVFNKIDRIEPRGALDPLRRRFPSAHFVSVHTGEGIAGLLEHMAEEVSGEAKICTLQIPVSQGDKLARLHRSAKVLQTEYADDLVCVTAVLPARLAADYSAFIKEN